MTDIQALVLLMGCVVASVTFGLLLGLFIEQTRRRW